MDKIKNTIVISSCKGGVGKSTISAGLAYNLAQQGLKVGLVDVDIHGPSIPKLFNIESEKVYTNEQGQLIPLIIDGLKIMSFGFLLGDGPAVMRGPIVSRYVQQVIVNTDWGELDYLLIDLPPGTGDVQLTITQQLKLNGAVIVTTPQSLSLIDVSRGIIMFEKVNVPVIGVVENMSYFLCDQCDKKHRIFGTLQENYFEDKFGIKKIAELKISNDYSKAPQEYAASDDFDNLSEAMINKIDQIGAGGTQQIPKIKFDENQLILKWSENDFVSLDHKTVRLQCPCAVCVDEMTGEKRLDMQSIKDAIAPESILPLGNYAIAITWNDGHSSGIYPFAFLKGLKDLDQSKKSCID